MVEIADVFRVVGTGNGLRWARGFMPSTVGWLDGPEMSGVGLRELAWELEEDGLPTLLSGGRSARPVAGPRTNNQARSPGLPLLARGPSGVHRRYAAIKTVFGNGHSRSGACCAQPDGRDRVGRRQLLRRRPGVLTQVRGRPGGPGAGSFIPYKVPDEVGGMRRSACAAAEPTSTDWRAVTRRNDPRVTRGGRGLPPMVRGTKSAAANQCPARGHVPGGPGGLRRKPALYGGSRRQGRLVVSPPNRFVAVNGPIGTGRGTSRFRPTAYVGKTGVMSECTSVEDRAAAVWHGSEPNNPGRGPGRSRTRRGG